MLSAMLQLFAGLLAATFVYSIVAGSSSAGNLNADFPFVFRLAAKLRTTMLMFVVVPLSFLKRSYEAVEAFFQRRKPAGSHQEKVKDIAQQIKAWDSAGRKQPLRTARPNWLSMSTKLGSNKSESHRIKMTHLNSILALDTEALTVTCESSVNFGELSHYLVPLGYALEVHVEMESITVGGAALGMGMETSSHKYGFFQETVLEYELVDSRGDILKATATEHSELFYALPWSHGTLGFLTKLVLKIRKIKPYVKMQYIATNSRDELTKLMWDLSTSETPPDFLEATIYTFDQAVIQSANFVDAPTLPAECAKMNSCNYWFKPFFFRHVETFLGKTDTDNYEYLPYMHFMHRFTRSIFWEIEDMIPFANHPLYRFFWGWMGPPEVSLLKLFQGPVIRKASVYAHVVQESIMPVKALKEGIEKFDEWYGVYPLLVFPLKIFDRKEQSGMLNIRGNNLVPGKNYGMYLDLGAYGAPRAIKMGNTWDPKPNVRAMEHWTRDKNGFCALYTDVFATRRELRDMFDHSLLDSVRTRLKCQDAFPEVYDKIKSEPGIVDLKAELAAEAKESSRT